MIALDTDVLLYACDRADSRRQHSEDVPGLPALGTLRVVNPFS
jgi:hypothetical protein